MVPLDEDIKREDSLIARYMSEPVKASHDNNGLIMENSAQRLSGEASRALEIRRAAHVAMLQLAHEGDLTAEMRTQSLDLRRRVARATTAPGANFDTLEADLRSAAFKRSDQISTILKDRAVRKEHAAVTETGRKWSDLFFLPPVDHSFWWANTHSHVAPDTRSAFRDDGLHFWGGPKVQDYDGEMHTSLGAVASFALQPARFPTSPSGRFLSSPAVELIGGIVAFAPDWDLIQGNGIASCELFLRQTIFQFGFGSSGPVPVKIAEAQGYDAWRIYLKNTGFSRHLAMPGFKAIPPVIYSQNQLAPNELWAEVEVRLDIYLNCTGALVWCDPDLLLRTFQWAPTPL